MKLSTFKSHLQNLDGLTFHLPSGKVIPSHFHITEIGLSTKEFIDCGGTRRSEHKASFQLWTSIDFHHRLKAEKLLRIIDMADVILGEDDLDVEFEYQGDTIGRYGVTFQEGSFVLTPTKTACLAEENCGIPIEKVKQKISEVAEAASGCCSPESDCC